MHVMLDSVISDFNSIATVQVDQSYSGKMVGLCGDCDGHPDDEYQAFASYLGHPLRDGQLLWKMDDSMDRPLGQPPKKVKKTGDTDMEQQDKRDSI